MKITITDIMEAYMFTLDILDELKQKGVEVTISQTGDETNKDIVKKYSQPTNLPLKHWVHVQLEAKRPEHVKEIADASMKLSKSGINFDTGGGEGFRDWELDWSFSHSGIEDEKITKAKMNVEKMICEIEAEGIC